MAHELRLYGQQPIGFASTVGVIKNAAKLVEVVWFEKFAGDSLKVNDPEPFQGKLLDAPPGLYDLDMGNDWKDMIIVATDNIKQIMIHGVVAYKGSIKNYPKVTDDVLRSLKALNLKADRRIIVYQDEKGHQQIDIQKDEGLVPVYWQNIDKWRLVGRVELVTGDIVP